MFISKKKLNEIVNEAVLKKEQEMNRARIQEDEMRYIRNDINGVNRRLDELTFEFKKHIRGVDEDDNKNAVARAIY